MSVRVLGHGESYALSTGPGGNTYKTSPFLLEHDALLQFCMYRASQDALLTVNLLGDGLKLPLYSSEDITLHEWMCRSATIKAGGYEGVSYEHKRLC